MRSAATISRGLFVMVFAVALFAAFGCDGCGGKPVVTPPALACTDGGPVVANVINLECGGATGVSTEQVDVVMGGPSTGTTTVAGFNFDVIYDPAKLEFVPSTSYPSALMPDALVVVDLLDGLQGKVIVAVQQPGNLPDVSIGAGQHTIVSLSFRRVSGATFGPTPLTLENAEAMGASPAIGFDSDLALSYQ